ncbi:hypothetical protein JOD31_003230 [Methylopila capsulata]|uniref:DUF3616 domain-containing protein n=1 Tax=Methylopila capsulata TaxID=61654 RepID=A0A9W6IZ52_9HYPH|nr:DUF3616 domain-containing protein [Methylopila capsulata]MBM7852979.1 hypothetical protein [Methylopila capsulata]GLK57810.1 hypothetical protein GCM10008170_38300 [Methylopila capsulata]
MTETSPPAPAQERDAKLVGRLPLAFHDDDPNAEKALHEDISAIVAMGDGESLWVGVDEGASLERLVARRDPDGAVIGYGGHVRFDLHDFFDFPSGETEEADVEGLSIADGYLWVVGSHSLKRKKPKHGDQPDEALEQLTKVQREANRFLIGRIPIAAGDRPGAPTLAVKAPALDGGKRERHSGALPMGRTHSRLSKLLAKDVHLGPFLSIPSKDNGFDVEGLAVIGERVFLGLRGPVLRGWAIVLELRIAATRKGRLKLKPVGEDGALYRKHFLDLDGLGVRSLLVQGNDMLLLTGPTMDLDGPVRLHRWRNALLAHDSSVIPREEVAPILDLPFGEGVDHAEGATIFALRPGAKPTLVVAYDSPSPARVLPSGQGALADVFELPELV